MSWEGEKGFEGDGETAWYLIASVSERLVSERFSI
jgi:hypothetical protein